MLYELVIFSKTPGTVDQDKKKGTILKTKDSFWKQVQRKQEHLLNKSDHIRTESPK